MIYLVRHGQTDWNKLRKFSGLTETELNQTGIEQAKEQAEKVKNITFDKCFCSTQKRARQTCEIIYDGTMIFDQRLTEINCGEFEGTEETIEAMELFWQAVQKGERGTESLKDFMARNSEFCTMVIEHHKGENILIVTHAANARILNYFFSGRPKDYDFTRGVAQSGEILIFEN